MPGCRARDGSCMGVRFRSGLPHTQFYFSFLKNKKMPVTFNSSPVTLDKQSWYFAREGRLRGKWVCLHCRERERRCRTAGQTWLTFTSQALHPRLSPWLLSRGVPCHFTPLHAVRNAASLQRLHPTEQPALFINARVHF